MANNEKETELNMKVNLDSVKEKASTFSMQDFLSLPEAITNKRAITVSEFRLENSNVGSKIKIYMDEKDNLVYLSLNSLFNKHKSKLILHIINYEPFNMYKDHVITHLVKTTNKSSFYVRPNNENFCLDNYLYPNMFFKVFIYLETEEDTYRFLVETRGRNIQLKESYIIFKFIEV